MLNIDIETNEKYNFVKKYGKGIIGEDKKELDISGLNIENMRESELLKYTLNNLIVIDFDKLWKDYTELSRNIEEKRIISWIEYEKVDGKMLGNIYVKIKLEG